jgi:hypothetical protein
VAVLTAGVCAPTQWAKAAEFVNLKRWHSMVLAATA